MKINTYAQVFLMMFLSYSSSMAHKTPTSFEVRQLERS
jgi:hypothetical protein